MTSNQMSLFKNTPDNAVWEGKQFSPSESLYWVANSAMQKCIRRGLVDRALFFGRLLYLHKEEGLRKRLMIISMEDIGLGDWQAMGEVMIAMASSKKKSWETYAENITKLAKAVKNRDADDGVDIVYHLIRKTRKFPPTDDDAEIGAMLPFGDYLKEERANHKDWWDAMEEEADGCPRLLARIQFLRPFETRASWHANHMVLLLLARWDREKDVITPPVEVVDNPKVNEFEFLDEDGVFPAFALDWHTRYGKMAYSIAAGKAGVSAHELHLAVFFSEGAALRNYCHWKNDYRANMIKWYFPKGLGDIEKAMAMLPDLRRSLFAQRVWADHLRESRK